MVKVTKVQRNKTTTKKKPAKKVLASTTKPKKTSVLSKVVPAKDTIDRSYLKMVIYGEAGSGKTSFWTTFPGRKLVLIFSGGKQSGELLSLSDKELEDVDVLRVDPEDLAGLYQELETSEYETVVLDHITGLQDFLIMKVGDLEEMPVQYSWGIITQEQWGMVANQLKTHLRGLFSFPKNVVIVGQQKVFETDSENDLGEAYVSAAVIPSVATWLHPAADYICQTTKQPKMVEKTKTINGKKKKVLVEVPDEVEYCLRIAPSSTFITKFRKPKEVILPKLIVNPSYDSILSYVKGI